MGGCRCSYKNCKNTTKTTENVHFFHYPVKHKERCRKWIQNACKPQFCILEEDQLRNKVICEIHFEDRYFPNIQKKRLLQGAIPTLDAGCVEEPPPPKPSQYHDIQVLPVSNDGTIFLLDTDSMHRRNAPSHKVESYIYRNGSILPSEDFKIEPSEDLTPPKKNLIPVAQYTNRSKETKFLPEIEPQFENVVIKSEEPDISAQQFEKPSITSMDAEMTFEEHPVCDTKTMPSPPNKNLPKDIGVKNVAKGSIEKSVGRNYLRKIKQHSRDIATIKRMLKEKNITSRPDNQTILNSIKGHLPSSLFSIVSLNLNNKCELNEEDLDFFATIYTTSPEVYHLLIERYNWNLPTPDILESLKCE